ncbi:MAG: hypothetical protein Q9195_002380 [Heterodermia aff. obscurata]
MAPATSVEWNTPRLNHAVIALSLVKSKPRSLSVRGKQPSCSSCEDTLTGSSAFIVTLRDFIQKGRRADVHENDEQFLDSIAFWRNAYEKSQDVEQQLRAKILILEQRSETISRTPGQATLSTGTSQQKRKRENSTTRTTSGGRATKRVKSIRATAVPQSNAVQPILTGHSHLDLEGIELSNCLHRISEIQQAVSNTANNNTAQGDQACLAIQSAADARRILLSIQTHTTQKASPQSKARTITTRIQEKQSAHTHAEVVNDAEMKCKVVIQLFPFLLRVLDSLYEPSKTSDLRDQVIHCIIYLFESLLEHICNLSACEGLQKPARVASGEKTGKANGRLLAETADFLSAPSAASKSASEKVEDKVIKMLCQLAVVMMNDLDVSILARQEVFDGFLFFLLLQVGRLLKASIFGVESQSSAKDVRPEGTPALNEAQAPYLIFLLKHARSLAPQRTGIAASSLQEDARRFESMSHVANVRLQHTLLKGVFGEQADAFMESLRRPNYTSTECELAFEEQGKRQKDRNMSEWFQNEVWETVGWDVLHEMVAWT